MDDSSVTRMRDTDYATELASAAVFDGESEIRIERLYVKAVATEEIRFSWWESGRMLPRPADLPEGQLITLFRNAIANNVFSAEFLADLKGLLLADTQ
jgi:hypothetical protein